MELIKIAWRNIWRSKTRSLIVIAAVTIGMVSGTFSTAVMIGAINQRIESAIANEVSHIQIHNENYLLNQDAEFYIQNSDEIINKAYDVEEVKAVSPRLKIMGMAATAENTTGITISGINPEQEKQVSKVWDKIIEGDYFAEDRNNQIIVSKRLADKLNLKIKSKIILTFIDSNGEVSGGAFRVCGIFNTKNQMFDETNVFVRKSDLHKATGYDKAMTHEIAILLNDNDDLDEATTQLKASIIGGDLIVRNWKVIQPDLSIMTDMVEQFAAYIIFIILLALAFGIINTMLMAILERKKELGMLMAIGMNRKRIRRMITWETTFLTSVGAIVGILIAQALVSYFGVHGIDLGSYAEEGFEALGFSSVIYPSLNSAFYVQVSVLVFVTAMIANVFPVRRAVKMNPAETLRTA